MATKPHIHYRRGWWLCNRLGSYIQGIGRTPREAYADYGRYLRSYVDAQRNVISGGFIPMPAPRRSWWRDLFGG